MTHSKLILMAGIIMVLAFSVTVAAQGKTKDVNVVNEPNVNVLNNVDVNVTNDENNPVPVTVLNGNNGAAEKELKEFVQLDIPLDSTFGLFTVPAGKKLLITDIIVHSIAGALMQILRNGTVVSRFWIQDAGTGTFGHSYNSGIEFQDGDILGIRVGIAATDNGFELRGYLTDVNGS